MSENVLEQFRVLPANLFSHLLVTVIALEAGAAISLPLAIWLVKHPRLRYPALTVVSVIQTIPSLALLALMVPILAGLSALLLRTFGVEIQALGFYPTVIGLTLYSMLPMVRNTVTGILGVEPAMTEAARGVGMTSRQILWKVELPLAAPVIIAGIRTATVWVVGIATLATPVGQRCLGNYIFRGLQTRNWTAVLFGCVAAAMLAITLDLLIGGLEKSAKDRRRRMGIICGAVLIAIFAVGHTGPRALAWMRNRGIAQDREVIHVGSKTFTEQYILASLIGSVVRDAGYTPQQRASLGSTVGFDALRTGQIDCYVDYTGTIWANYMKRTATPGPREVLEGVTRWLRREHGIRCLGPLGFENAYGLAMRREQAGALHIESIADLARHAPEMTIGGDYEFFGRPEWRKIRDLYGLNFAAQNSYDATFMYSAIKTGDVDVISAFTSDGRIGVFDLVVLDDPKQAIPPYDAVLLLSARAAREPELVEALESLINAIPVELIRQANDMVDRGNDKRTVDQAAKWLRARITGP